MVMCKMDTVSVPKPPAFPDTHVYAKAESGSIRSKSSHGFRLVEDNGDSGSVYSVYKQKIDAMFESDSSINTKNSVQARIERMFSDVAKDNGIPMNDIGCHVFSVDYLGSVALQEKVTSLAGLQTPLRELYFAYKKTSKHKEALTGRLEISAAGLKVQYQGENGDLEQLNPFPTIAVWSAVKFVLHDDPSASYAFLPLITDPDNIDKQTLFRALEPSEQKLVEENTHSPLFAVVMRKLGVQKQLECHGFVCQTSEDAIVVAATLYKSLMAHMKAKEMRPKNRNGVTCMSIASSIFNEKSGSSVPVRPPRKKRSTASSIASDGEGLEVSDTQPLLQEKNAKKCTKSKKAPKVPESKQDLDAILPCEEPNSEKPKGPKQLTLTDKWNTYKSNRQKVITAEIKQVLEDGPLKRTQSIRRRNSEGMLNTANENSGDILTKVTIPRSGSFLNAGGLTRYKSKVYRANGQASGGSPLGFHELFNEFRLQEGLHSVDEILSVIIDPEGMSFNDLKPIYKEFLLKLALTLTKDELYQRSKAIMRRQKKKLLRRNSAAHPKKPHTVMGSKFKRLGSIFKKPLKLKASKRSKSAPSLRVPQIPPRIDLKLPESSISTSSYDTRQFHPREPALVNRRPSYRKRSSESKICHKNRMACERASTSEESDFFSLRRSKAKQNHLPSTMQNRNSSSGYVSCSECSYDSDTCTCVSADKCYCSLGNKNPPKRAQRPKHSYQNLERCSCGLDSSLVWCGCDTDSCTDSNKCYCQINAERNGTIFEQLKQRGFIPSAGTVAITPPNHRKLCKRVSNSRSTRSLEYMHNPSEAYYEKLAHRPGSVMERGRGSIIVDKRRRSCNLPLDYELFAITEGSVRGMTNGLMLEKSLSESGHLKVYQPASVRSRHSIGYGGKGNSLQSTTITSGACNEALSVKKSAEIAALFADIKLSQTTDITHIAPQLFRKTSISSGRTTYNKIVPMKNYSKLIRQSPNEIVPYQKIVQNSLYSTKGMQKSGMYSATNGLYTIQSQSDESRRSSISAVDRQKDDHEYFNVENKNVSSSMENSLGYLP